MEGVGKWTCRMQFGQTIPCDAACAAASWAIARCAVAVRDIRTASRPRPKSANWPISTHLTGLSNRRSLLEQVVQELAAADLQPRRAALATININAFQSINDSLGMAAGDMSCLHHGTAAERAAKARAKRWPGGW